jgi:hypothetical protein
VESVITRLDLRRQLAALWIWVRLAGEKFKRFLTGVKNAGECQTVIVVGPS